MTRSTAVIVGLAFALAVVIGAPGAVWLWRDGDRQAGVVCGLLAALFVVVALVALGSRS